MQRSWFRFWVWAVCGPLLLVACAKTFPSPRLAVPAVVERHDPRETPPSSHLSFEVASDLTVFEPVLVEELSRALHFEQKDWTRAAQNGFAELDTRMRAEVHEAKLEMDASALQLIAKVHYFGQFRARIKTPIGRMWLTQGTDWGTREAPGTVTVTVRIEPKIDAALKLTTRSSLVKVAFETPPGGDLCTSGAFRLCVPRERAADAIHPEIEKLLRKETPRALSALDRVVSREVGLSRVLGPVIEALWAPQKTVLQSYLTLAPKAVALAPPEGKGNLARLRLELWLQPDFEQVEHAVTPEKPLYLAPSDAQSELHLDLLIPLSQLSLAYSEACLKPSKGDVKIRRMTVLGAAMNEPKVILELEVSRGERQVVLYALARPVTHGGSLSLSELAFTPDSEALLTSWRADPKSLAESLMRDTVIALAPFLADHVAAIRTRLAPPLLLFGALELNPESQAFSDELFFDGRALRVRANVGIAAKVKR